MTGAGFVGCREEPGLVLGSVRLSRQEVRLIRDRPFLMVHAREFPAMSDEHAGEYDLADAPEPPKKRPAPPPEKPLPRLWKTEPEEDEEKRADVREEQAGDSRPRKRSRQARSGEARKRSEDGEVERRPGRQPRRKEPRRGCWSRKPLRSTPMKLASAPGCSWADWSRAAS